MASKTQVITAFLILWVGFFTGMVFVINTNAINNRTMTIVQPMDSNSHEIDENNVQTAMSESTNLRAPNTTNQASKQRLFSDSQIQNTFNKYIKPKMENESYLTQYEWISNATWLAPEFNASYWTHADGTNRYFDISRVIQTASFRKYLQTYNILNTHCDHVLTFNVDVDPEAQYFNGALTKHITYPSACITPIYGMLRLETQQGICMFSTWSTSNGI
eukprot:590488_1